MADYFATVLDQGVDQTVALVTEALKSEGFGVLTTIDVQATLKSKLGVDFPEYRILGACNPMLAHEALQIEDKVETMLPCNVVGARPRRRSDGSGRDRSGGLDASDSERAVEEGG